MNPITTTTMTTLLTDDNNKYHHYRPTKNTTTKLPPPTSPTSLDRESTTTSASTIYQHSTTTSTTTATLLDQQQQSRSHSSRRTASTGATSSGSTPQHYCFGCHQPCVPSDRSPIQALGRIYHYQCFVCEDCHVLVTDKYYALDHDPLSRSIVCERHYYARLNRLCKQCGEPLLEGATTEMIDGYNYHQQCLQCPGCLLAKKAKQQKQRSSKLNIPHLLSTSSNRSTTTSISSNSSSTRSSIHNEYYFDDNIYREKYSYDGRSYCQYHFSLLRSTACFGCGQTVLSQSVNDRDNPDKLWHHECFMIQKYWNVRLADQEKDLHGLFLNMSPDELMKLQLNMEQKRKHVWNELKGYEDSLASCIKEMAVDVTGGPYLESVQMANQLAWHLCVLFSAHQKIHSLFEEYKPHHYHYHQHHRLQVQQEYECDKWTRIIGVQILRLFDLIHAKKDNIHLDPHQQEEFRKQIVQFVTALAHNVKECLRLGITEALEMEHEYGVNDTILTFIQEFAPLKKSRVSITSGRYWLKDTPFSTTTVTSQENEIVSNQDKCRQCHLTIEETCWRFHSERWHTQCLECNHCHQKIEPPFNARIGVHYLVAGSKKKSIISSNKKKKHSSKQQDEMMTMAMNHSNDALQVESNLILLCDKCTIDPRTRRNYLMQQQPLSRVTQLEQCMHLLRVAVARVHQVPISGNVTQGKKGLPAIKADFNNKLQVPPLLTATTAITTTVQHVNKEQQPPTTITTTTTTTTTTNTNNTMISRQPQSQSPSSSPSSPPPPQRMTLESSPAVVRFQHQEQSPSSVFGAPLFFRNTKDAVKRSKSSQQYPQQQSTNSDQHYLHNTTTTNTTSNNININNSNNNNNNNTSSNTLPRRAVTISTKTAPYHTNENNNTTKNNSSSPTGADEKMFSSSTNSSLSSKKLTYTLRRALSTGRPGSSASTSQQQQQNRLSIINTSIGGGTGTGNHSPLTPSPTSKSKIPTAETITEPGGPFWLTELTTMQDSIVRSLAALYIERHVSNFFEFEELVSFVEGKKESLWGKVKLHFRNSSNTYRQPSPSASMDTSSSMNNKIFGASLKDVSIREKQQQQFHIYDQRTRAAAISYVMTHHPTLTACFSENAMVPSVVQNIILALLNQDLTTEGIFRKNGNIRELKEMCDMVDKGQDYTHRLFHESSAIQLAALLKRFVRDLPEPLLTFKLYKLFLTSLKMANEQEAKTVLYFACCMLPKPNRDVMQLLFLFLNHVASLHEQNKMDIHNIARIFCPSVLFASPTSQSQPQSSQTTREEIEVVSMLIKYQPDFNLVPQEFTLLMQDTNMMKALYNADLTSSKEFIKTYSSLMKLRKNANNTVSTRPGEAASISPLATRSAVVLPTSTAQQVGR